MKEVLKSNTAIKNGIDNKPTEEHFKNIVTLAEKVFQPLRDAIGKPIKVTSGYRSKELNDIIGGSSTSQHCKGQALDIDVDGVEGVTNAELFDYIANNLEFDQLIWEFGTENNPDWVHVSYNEGNNRNQKLKAYRKNGRTYYQAMI